MPSHHKTPMFIKIITNPKQVVCINPFELSSFQIIEKAKIKKLKDDKDFIEADTIRFFYPSGTGLSYSVDVDITRQQYDYICATLLEWTYLNEAEFVAKSKAIEQGRIDEWNRISQENEAKLLTEGTPVTQTPKAE